MTNELTNCWLQQPHLGSEQWYQHWQFHANTGCSYQHWQFQTNTGCSYQHWQFHTNKGYSYQHCQLTGCWQFIFSITKQLCVFLPFWDITVRFFTIFLFYFLSVFKLHVSFAKTFSSKLNVWLFIGPVYALYR